MAGFRAFVHEWVVSSTSTEGSVADNGRITNLDGTFGYTSDALGVKACLEDFCDPLVELENNNEGWQIDTDLCPIKQAVLLPPNTDVYVMFFKHTTGARLMIGLNLWGMFSYPNKPNNYSSVGFLSEKTFAYSRKQGTTTTSFYPSMGGIFTAMIPPCKSGEVQETFTLDYSIQDVRFYPKTMTPVFAQKTYCRYYYDFRNSYIFPCASWIHVGQYDNNTSDVSISQANTYGAVVGKKIVLNLLISDEVIFFAGSYNSLWNGAVIIGRILSNCRNQDDILSTNEYACLCSESGSSNGQNCYLWKQNYNYEQFSVACNITGTYWSNIKLDFSKNGYESNSNNYVYLYQGYVSGASNSYPMSVNGNTKARLRGDLFRFISDSSTRSTSQYFNNKEWKYMPYIMWYNGTYSIENSSSNSVPTQANILCKLNSKANGDVKIIF